MVLSWFFSFFQKGEQYFVELFNENTMGYVVVDALQILAL